MSVTQVTGQGACCGSTRGATGCIGVAIPVPAPLGDQLQRRRAASGDPLAWSVPTHVTLVPPVVVGEGALPRVHDHLARAASSCAPFEIRLRGTDTFRPVSPVVFVRLAAGAREVARLEEHVRCGVLDSRRRFPFHPHVTLAQEVDDAALDRAHAELADFEAAFTVERFTLYRHDADGVWRVVEEYQLGQDAPARGSRA